MGPCNPWPGMPSSSWAESLCVPLRVPVLFPEMGCQGRLPFILLPRLFLATLFFTLNFLCFYKLCISHNYWSWLLPMVPMIIFQTLN